jgi:hypothetical protein
MWILSSSGQAPRQCGTLQRLERAIRREWTATCVMPGPFPPSFADLSGSDDRESLFLGRWAGVQAPTAHVSALPCVGANQVAALYTKPQPRVLATGM